MKSEAFWGALLSILVVFSVVGVVWAVSDHVMRAILITGSHR